MTMRCEITELPAAWCAHCTCPKAPTPPDPFDAPADPFELAEKRVPWVAARYDGRCRGCGESFYAGEQIQADGDGGWLAQCCGDDA